MFINCDKIKSFRLRNETKNILKQVLEKEGDLLSFIKINYGRLKISPCKKLFLASKILIYDKSSGDIR